MPNIKPVSDLRNYNEVLSDVAVGAPVFLTKNGRGRYAIVDIVEYQRSHAMLTLMKKIREAEESVKKEGWLTLEEVEERLGIKE
jgi:hypothetical protein